MTATDWIPVHRPSDDELVGYLALDGRGATPLTLVGYPLAGPLERADAEELLRSRGLAVLAEPWWLEEDGGGFRVQILSARPDAVVVARADYGFVSHDSERRELALPAAGLRPYAG
jgi:hypothetical protein